MKNRITLFDVLQIDVTDPEMLIGGHRRVITISTPEGIYTIECNAVRLNSLKLLRIRKDKEKKQ